ncbi:sensor histidine kinase [Streptomyces sp. SID13666]|uniref:sensor histidine kinase n=1 Tax=unclassified Streptomyces TaxID=2593676 RepID=UPI0013BFFF5F|nr:MULTISPECIES: sensor histidine kinase [unclassified Streptomyces]NEA59581.1 sensor histidine kinase [Streptomyces sp. SID13666]NEA72694.1 sensor histidine kinase [Streptomyces sp. SID13588]
MNIRNAGLAGIRGLALAALGLVESIVLFVFAVLSIAFISLGIGIFTTPWMIARVRDRADHRRELALRWSGVEIARPYRPAPEFRPGIAGSWRRLEWVLTDPATWRDLQWLLVDMTAGAILAYLTAGLFLEGAFGWVLAASVWRPIVTAGGTYWYAFIPVSDQTTAVLAALLGTVWILLGLRFSPTLLHRHALLTRAFLAPTPAAQEEALKRRVARLAETRSDAVDSSAAELRRIERDLHDGAQARLVAMGMNLGIVEHLLEQNPEKARKILSEARQSSADALTELRDLVRGIHPPVLAERGLGDAVRALALRGPIPTDVNVDLAGRFEAPVESAAYFTVSELLTNAAKHSGAERIWIDLRHEDGMLRVSVTDDGSGGADVSRGTGLQGIERRLGAFDGVLAVNSPVGGPTMVTMELPCAPAAPAANQVR